MESPETVQRHWLRQILQTAKHTEWGQLYDFRSIRNPETFARRVPIQDYESLWPYIRRMMQGEKDVLWNGQVRWFAKSSGTTGNKSKFIPVSSHNLKKCHIRGTWDTMTLFYHNRPDARQFELKSMLMGGSLETYAAYPRTQYGDVSAIMTHHMPLAGRPFFTPDIETALMSDWEAKLERLARVGAREKNVVMIGGVPTWTVVLFNRILEITGKKHMLEVWPNFQVYIHGGVSFTPYKSQFAAFFPSEKVSYQEIYNASEGYFAAQDDLARDDMLLLLNNGIYYEFLPVDQWADEHSEALPIWEVQTGKQYAIVITTNGGLWRYAPGDTVEFTSVRPYRIKVTGRTKQYINAFGEEVIVENTDKALAITCEAHGATVTEYTVAPVYFEQSTNGGHEWLIEFDQAPASLANFARDLDQNLQRINSDYEAKRFRNLALQPLRLRPLAPGTFHKWMRSRGKLGGQHKVPRLANNRKYLEDILVFAEEKV